MCRREVITWGLFSRGTNILRFCCWVVEEVVVAGVVSAMVVESVGWAGRRWVCEVFMDYFDLRGCLVCLDKSVMRWFGCGFVSSLFVA